MFRSSTILRELVQSLAKFALLLKYSLKLRHCILCGDVAACRETACVLFVVQTARMFHIQRKPRPFKHLQAIKPRGSWRSTEITAELPFFPGSTRAPIGTKPPHC